MTAPPIACPRCGSTKGGQDFYYADRGGPYLEAVLLRRWCNTPGCPNNPEHPPEENP